MALIWILHGVFYALYFPFSITLILDSAFLLFALMKAMITLFFQPPAVSIPFLLESYLILYPQIPFFHKPECENHPRYVKGEKLKTFTTAYSPFSLRKVLLSL